MGGTPLGGDEFENIVSGDLKRVLLDNGEEDFQVIPGGKHRVGAAPGGDEPQVVVKQLVAEPDLDAGVTQRSAGQARHEHRHVDRTLRFPPR